jgi:hypothetical protein
MPGAVHDSRGRAQSEADRTFLALNHNRLAGLIGGYRAGSVSCGCLCCRCWFCRCRLLSRCRAGLPKSQGRNERADESNKYFLHYNASLFMLMFTPQLRSWGTWRTLTSCHAAVFLFDRLRGAAIRTKFPICVIERGCGFANVTCR